jgi:lysophospholipase L1-like esterase
MRKVPTKIIAMVGAGAAVNAGYNGAIATNGAVTFGFNGSWTGSNPVPAGFALNGTTCTGTAGGSPTPTVPTPTVSTTPTASASSPTPAPGRPSQCTGASPIVCHFAVSPGNYTVSAGAVVADYADSGESSGSFLSNKALFPTMNALVQNNDLVFVQFGHNDQTTTAAAYRSNLTSMINQVRARGGTPVLVTPPVRHLFSGTKLTDTALHVNSVGVNLPAEMRSLASSLNVPLIDLTAKSQALVESLGPTDSAQLYLRAAVDGVKDDTHFSEYGAGQMADLVVQGIRKRNLSLAGYLG